jgi:hypothetical protein
VIGADQLELWARGLELFLAARPRVDPARICDVEYDDFVADPIGTVESVYARFGIELTGRAADAMRHLASRASAGAAHAYSLADFGLTAEQVDERFAGYARWLHSRSSSA